MRRILISCVVTLVALAATGCPPAATVCAGVADCQTGQLCKDKACAACSGDGDCSADYGAGATCADGACHAASCVDGKLGCACIGGTSCDQGECVAGTCTDCARGSLDCVCFDNNTCDQGLLCGSDHLCDACTDGVQGCPCRANGSCDGALICDNQVCVTDPCPRGTVGCACRTGDLCDATLYCTGNNLCAACSNDIVGCPCTGANVCTNDLVCDSGDHTCREAIFCTDAGCAAHQACQETTAGVDAVCLSSCVSGFRWNGSNGCDELNCATGANSIASQCTGQNRACVATSGSGAVCGACLANFVDESGTLTICRAARTCSDLNCASQHRECQAATSSADAVCQVCVAGYIVDGTDCVVQTCVANGPGSILAACTAAHRLCNDPFDAPASCGDCTGGYIENSSGDCQLPHTCDVSDLNCAAQNRRCEGEPPLQHCGDCLAGTAPLPTNPSVCAAPVTCQTLNCGAGFCVEGAAGQNATCITATCGNNQASKPSDGTCVSCIVSCNASDTGETGRIWPVALASDHCLCETRDGFYWDDGDRQAKPCDADGDGWVRESARSAVNATDVAMKQNARCHVRTVDRFVLANEVGQRLPVYLCAGTPAQTHVRADCTSPKTIDLYESVRNDNQNEIDLDPNAPPYWRGPSGSESGRRLRASELNGLTRACVNEGGDYNHNGVADLREWHGMPAGTMTADQSVFAQFSYYMELYRGWYERGTESLAIGQYVIAERSRCATDFVLGYGVGESDYWKSCTRSRDVAYNGVDGPTAPDFGLDFARWSCEAEQGGCPIPPPPTDVVANSAIPEHGLCRNPALPPPIEQECRTSGPWPCVGGRVWRGMSHHSQFRCVLVRANAGSDTPTLPQADFSDHKYVMNLCRVACPTGDAKCDTDCASGTCVASTEAPGASVDPANPSHTKLRCDIDQLPSNGAVGFAAVKYVGGSAYARGCINEWTPTSGSGTTAQVAAWSGLCPGWIDDPVGSVGQGDPSNFGQLQCGCGNNYGGPNCDVGCPDAQLNLSVGYNATPRAGYWMCADFSTTSYSALDATYGPALVGGDGSGSTYLLRDDLGSPIDGQPLCEFGADCTTGYVIH